MASVVLVSITIAKARQKLWLDFQCSRLYPPALYVVRNKEEAITLTTDSAHGSSATIGTRDMKALDMAGRLEHGQVHVNTPTVYDESTLPVKRFSNHTILAPSTCAYSQITELCSLRLSSRCPKCVLLPFVVNDKGLFNQKIHAEHICHCHAPNHFLSSRRQGSQAHRTSSHC